MKKYLSLLMAVLLVLSLAACGDKRENGDNSDDSGVGSFSSSVPDKSEKLESDKSEKVEPDKSKLPDKSIGDGSFSEEVFGPEKPISPVKADEFPIVIVDNDDYCWRIEGPADSQFNDFVLDMYVENKTSDKNIAMDIKDTTLNGVFVGYSFAANLKPGESYTGLWSFNDYDHEYVDIGDYTDIGFKWEVTETSDTSNPQALESGEMHVYPYGEDSATLYVREAKSTDEVAMDNELVKVTYDSYGYDVEDGSFYVLFYVERKSEAMPAVSVDDGFVNGEDVLCYGAGQLTYGDKMFFRISWDIEDLAEAEIENIDNVRLELTVRDYGAETLEWIDEEFTIEPNFKLPAVAVD